MKIYVVCDYGLFSETVEVMRNVQLKTITTLVDV